MEWYQYYWQLLQRAFSQPLNWYQGISLALTILSGFVYLKKPKWIPHVNKLVWQIPFLVFCVLAVIGLISSPYWMYEDQQLYLKEQQTKFDTQLQQRSDSIAELESKMDALERQQLIQKRVGAVIYNDSFPTALNSMPIMVFATGDKTIYKYRIFDNCDIMGDSILHFTKCNFVSCSLSKLLGGFVVSSASQNYSSVITFDNCIFRDCRFWDIRIIGDDNEVRDYQKYISFR